MGDRLYRSGQEKMVAGVCGGLAEYFDVDVTLVRLIALMTLLAGGAGFLAYFVAWIIIPLDPSASPERHKHWHRTYYRDETRGNETKDNKTENYQAKDDQEGMDDKKVYDAEIIDETQKQASSEESGENEPGREEAEGTKGAEGEKSAGTESRGTKEHKAYEKEYEYKANDDGWYSGRRDKRERRRDGNKIAGIILIVLGLLFFVDRWFPWYSFDKTWPLFIIALGIFVIYRQKH